MENFTSQSVKRRIMWHIDYRGHSALPDLERAVTELTVIQRDVQAILPLAMVSRAGDQAGGYMCLSWLYVCNRMCMTECTYRSMHVCVCEPAPVCVAASCTQVCPRGKAYKCAFIGDRWGSVSVAGVRQQIPRGPEVGEVSHEQAPWGVGGVS